MNVKQPNSASIYIYMCVCVNRATLNGRLANEISLKGEAERDKEDKERSRLGAINTIHSNYEK